MPGAPVTVAFKTLGCKVNRVESEAIAAELLGCGVTLADHDAASVVVINTCTVTGEADAKARKAVRQALAAQSEPVVVVTGCLAMLDAEGISALGERVVVEADKAEVAARVAALLGTNAPSPGEPVLVRGEGFRTRAPLKIQDGCDAFCAYCIVPHARGVPRSVPLERIEATARALVVSGTPEIVLTGINLGRYSDGSADLAAVVEAVAASGIARVRLSSIEPMDLTERLLGVLASTPAVCEHLHVPLQSGSDAVLEAMGRGYTIARFEERIAAARAALPGLAITTDVIAGLPGETPADAQATLEACERIGFAKLHVFRYSERAGTPAAEMPGSVPKPERAARAEALRTLGERLAAAHAAAHFGHEVEVLVERVEDGRARGTTRDYLTVEFDAEPDTRVGALVRVVAP